MEQLQTKLDGPVLVKPTIHGDERGFFLESYRKAAYAELGITDDFVQDNHSRSRRGVVRGMHFQPGQAKLVRVVRGAILDVVCDIRPGSPGFGQWEAVELSDENAHQLYVPDGFAHGFAVTSEVADVVYKVSTYYDPDAESGFRFDDPEVGIDWPDVDLTPSARDSSAPLLSELADSLPFR
jgi:dTDP-4-dehydrorhamnose 3,5-epimerase